MSRLSANAAMSASDRRPDLLKPVVERLSPQVSA
jgi:hypothetical protein